MSIGHHQLRKLEISHNKNNFKVILLYPKIIVIETSRIIIVNLDKGTAKISHEDLVFDMESDVLDFCLVDNCLWIVLQCSEIMVINAMSGAHCKISIDNNVNYKIRHIKHKNKRIYLISEGGECLASPLTSLELDKIISEGTQNITVTLEKAVTRDLHLEYSEEKNTFVGINLSTDETNILAECPLTGLIQTIKSSNKLKKIMPWGDKVVLTLDSGMLLTDLETTNLYYEFEHIEGYFYPLGTNSDIFYYLTCDKNEVNVCGAWDSTHTQFGGKQGSDNNSTMFKKQTSQESLKNKLNSLIEIIEAGAKVSDVLPQLQNYFEKIEDLPFLVDISLKLCKQQPCFKILLYSLQKRVFTTEDCNLMFQLKDILIKIDVLDYIKFRSIDYYNAKDLFDQGFKELIITFVTKSDLDIASICWLKYSDSKLNMACGDVLEILNAVPQNIKLGSLIHWLKNFVPTILDENPFYIDIFVKWTTERVFGLEQSAYWPKIGIKFLEEIVTVLSTSPKTVPIRPISMDDLDSLKNHLNYIIELKEKYKINMLLAELSSQSPSEVALIMLKRCYTEDLSAFLLDYLPVYASRYMLELDETLCSFIDNEAACGGGSIDGVRLTILLKAFRNPTTKLECFLQVLKLLDVPWDSTVTELAVAITASTFKDFTASRADTVLAQGIQNELNYAKLKIIMKKYNLPLSCNDMMLILQNIINAQSVDLNDLKTVTNAMPVYTNCGHLLYINRCLSDCETRSALNYFNNLLLKEKRLVLKTVASKYEQIINNEISNAVLERNYLDFLKGTHHLKEFEIKSFENMYHLKNSFNCTLGLNDLNKEKKSVEGNFGQEYFMEQIAGMHYSQEFKMMKMLQTSSTSHEVRQTVKNLIICNKIELVLSQFENGNNCKLLLDTCDVLMQLVLSSAEEHLHYLMKYVTLLMALINTNVVMKNLLVVWKYNYVYLPLYSITAVNDLIKFYNNPEVSEEFGHMKYKGDFVTFRIISHLMNYSVPLSESLAADVYETQENTTKKILSKIASSQEFDEVLATSLLFILSNASSNDNIMFSLEALQTQNDSFPPNVMKYLSSTTTRRAFNLDNVSTGNVASYPPQFILKSKFNIDLDMAFSDATEETWDVKVLLFYVLKQYPETSFDRLTDLCRTLNISINDGLTLQLISLLTSWELKYKLGTDDLGNRQLHFETDENDIITKCLLIWESIENRDFLKEILSDFWKTGEITLHGRIISVNPYYYEVFLCIHRLIFGSTVESRNIKEYFLLHFLKNYKRKSAPKQYEYELFSVKGIFPEIGYYRLPFHLFMREDMWSNLKSEITLETYERWLPAGALLALDADLQTTRDMICSNALKQTMTSRKHNEENNIKSKETEPWRLTSKEEPLLRAAHRCVKHIANMEWAGACLFYVLQGCARGADQVAAAQLCYQFSQKWADVQPGNRAVRQMERLHLSLSTRHALHKIDWAREEFVRLAPEPAQLIRALYVHPDFVNKTYRHDINRAANEIADKNGINISSIRIQILENILEKSNKDNKNTQNSCLDSKDLLTAKYILKATCPKMGAIYLSRIAFDEDSEFNRCKKLRALQCLMSVVDTDTAIKAANRERDALWASLLEFIYIVNLENIDVPWIVATFVQDKERALEQLLPNVDGNIEALKIASEVACRYGNIKVIRDLLPLMLRTGLYEEMIPMLLKLSILCDETIILAWRAVILSPFQRADYPITERQRSKCLTAINLLPVCPVIKDEDLVEIWKNCIRCKNLGLGCLVLPYMTAQTRQTLSELQKVDRRNLIASLKNLHNETYLVAGAMYVIESMVTKTYR